MSTPDDGDFRAALRSLARPYILDLEHRGFVFRVHEGRVQIRPRDRLTDLERWTLRQHYAAVHTLIARRADWGDGATRPVPAFDPTRAFLTAEETAARQGRLVRPPTERTA